MAGRTVEELQAEVEEMRHEIERLKSAAKRAEDEGGHITLQALERVLRDWGLEGPARRKP